MLDRLRRILWIVFFAHVVGGLGVVLAVAFASPWVIGEGRVHGLLADFERYDFKIWLVLASMAIWLVPIVLVITWRNAKLAGLEAASVKAHVRELLEGRSFPVIVEVDTMIPVKLQDNLRVGFKVDTTVSVDDRISVEASIPLVTELPIDTEIATSVFGLGSVKIPIRGRIPLNITIPVRTTMHVRATDIPVHLEEEANVALPPLEVPIKGRIDAKIDILKTLDAGPLQT